MDMRQFIIKISEQHRTEADYHYSIARGVHVILFCKVYIPTTYTFLHIVVTRKSRRIYMPVFIPASAIFFANLIYFYNESSKQ